jgi:hypothetical protein
MTPKEIVDGILADASGHLPSDDQRMHPMMVRHWVQNKRAKFMDEFTDFGKDIHPELYQDLGVLHLTETDQSEDQDVPWGCTIRYVCIPPLHQFPDMRGLSVSRANKRNPVIITYPDVAYQKSSNRLARAAGMVWGYMIGNKLYVMDYDGDIEYVNVRAVFAEPDNLIDCAGNVIKCFDYENDKYPVPDKMLDFIRRDIFTTELGITLNSPNDQQNDARESAPQ